MHPLSYNARLPLRLHPPNYLSTSPNTKSIVPMIATASGKKWCLIIKSAPAKWAKPGARILHL